MEFIELHDLTWDSLQQLADEDEAILRGPERTVAGRLAIHLDRNLRGHHDGYVVDLEYARAGDDPKAFVGASPRRIVPDLLIHHRGLGNGDENLLVIEVKPRRATSTARIATDYAKLALMTGVDEAIIRVHPEGLRRVEEGEEGDLRLPEDINPYRYGLWVRFVEPEAPLLRWYARQDTSEWEERKRGPLPAGWQ